MGVTSIANNGLTVVVVISESEIPLPSIAVILHVQVPLFAKYQRSKAHSKSLVNVSESITTQLVLV